MAQSKATKKYEKRHLKDTLKRRKDFAKIKQRHQLNAKRKARRQEDATHAQNDGDTEDGPPAKRQKSDGDLGAMSVDEFFAESINLPTKPNGKKSSVKRPGKSKAIEPSAEDDSDASSIASLEEQPLLGGMGSEDEEGEADGEEDLDGDQTNIHKDELKALAEKDPEFYKYLQENDAELLDFAEDSNLAEIDELSGSEDESLTKRPEKKTQKDKTEESSKNEIGTELVRKWVLAINEKHSLRSLRELVLAFRAAAHLNEENGKVYRYTISNAEVYHEVLIGALNNIPKVLNYHMPIKELPNGKVRVNTETNKFKKFNSLLKSHTASVLHLMENLSDAATVKMTLNSLLALLPYTLSFKKIVKELTRVVVEIWSDSAQFEATRINAFLVIRRLIIIGDASIKENVLRIAYQGLVKGSRNTTVHNLSGINLMKNSAAELWSLADGNIAYTTGFTFVRQLAIHLRNSIKNNSNESYKTIYNWQYVHSLDFWSRVLALNCDSLKEASSGKESNLRPLIYPLTQVTLGAMRLIPTAAYFPLRFQLVRALLRLSQATNTFIPLTTPLYEVMTSAEMRKAPKPSTLRPLDFDVSIRASKSYLKTRVYQDGVGEQVVELLVEFFNLWGKSVAFPELALPVIVMLKRWLKEVNTFNSASGKSKGKTIKSSKQDGGNRNSKLNSLVALLIQKLEANTRWIEERRAKVDFAPNNRAGVEGFLRDVEWNKTPIGAFVEGQRKQREERRKIVEESRMREEEEREKEKKGRRNVNEADFGNDTEDDSDEAEDYDDMDEDELEEDINMDEGDFDEE